MSGRAGVAMEAPEMETSSTRQVSTMPSASCSVDSPFVGVMRSWRRPSAAELGAVGEPGQLRGKLLALVLRRVDLEGEAALELAHDRALDAADVVEVGDHALADRTATGDVMAAPPAEMSISLQGYSSLFSRMKRPSSVTAIRLWRRRSGTMRDRTPWARRANVI